MNTALEMGGSGWSALPVLVRASDRPPRSRRIIELVLAMHYRGGKPVRCRRFSVLSGH